METKTWLPRILSWVVFLSTLLFSPLAHSQEEQVEVGATQSTQAYTAPTQLNLDLPSYSSFRTTLYERAIKNQPGMNVEEKMCSATGVEILGNTTHVGGNPYKIFQERNDGLEVKCYTNEERTRYLLAGALENSQRGQSVVLGYGFAIRPLEYLPRDIEKFTRLVTLEYGVKVVYMSYEKRHGDVVYAILPIPYRRLVINVPGDWIKVGVTENDLLRIARLRSAFVEINLLKLERELRSAFVEINLLKIERELR